MGCSDIEIAPELRRQIGLGAFFGGLEIVDIVAPGARILDIGGGDGLHARCSRELGYHVDILDLREGKEPLVFEGRYEAFVAPAPYDVIWCSHVDEHIMNPGAFLTRIRDDLRPGGHVAITVPPMKSDMLFEHVTLWNGGLLLIHLVKCGSDTRVASVEAYHDNTTAIAQKTRDAALAHTAWLNLA